MSGASGATTDAIVVGSGVNALVSAAMLGAAGWSVRLLERSDRIGGFIDSGERTVPGYIHDTYSSWHPLFVSGGAYAALGDDLHRHGLAYRNTDDAVTASVGRTGAAVIAHRDPAATDFAHTADQDRYLGALDAFGANADLIGGLLGSEIRSTTTVSTIANLVRRNRVDGVEALVRDAVTSGRGWCRREFEGTEVDQLWVPWLLHSGLAPGSASGGLMIPIFAATMHGFGLPVVAGGAANFVDAFRRLLIERGVIIETGADVTSIDVSGGRASGVTLADGQHLRASRAVIASVTPGALYGQLLDPRVAGAAAAVSRRYRFGRAAMQIHVALDRAPRWTDERLNSVPLVHLSDGSSTTGVACAQAEAGALPTEPTVVVGQQFLVDDSRVPDGAGSLWIQLQELPFAPTSDSGGTIATFGSWTPDLARAYADRVLARIDAHAPGTTASVVGIDIISPADLRSYNVNAQAGDPYSGSAELDQNFVWRPTVGAGRHQTAVPGLWHIGASTHPGPGLGGGSGAIVAAALTTPPPLQRIRSRLSTALHRT